MKAKELAQLLMEHPDVKVTAYGIRSEVEPYNVIFNGYYFYIGA